MSTIEICEKKLEQLGQESKQLEKREQILKKELEGVQARQTEILKEAREVNLQMREAKQESALISQVKERYSAAGASNALQAFDMVSRTPAFDRAMTNTIGEEEMWQILKNRNFLFDQ